MKKNPYPGTREFQTEESVNFFGRKEDVTILSGLVQARRVALLFAPSGAGKSSLINAGLIPDLSDPREVGRGKRRRTVQKMAVLPVAQVGGGVSMRLKAPPKNLFVFSALHSMFPDAEAEDLVDQTLLEGVRPLTRRNGEDPDLLIFDQFEQLFTQHVDHWHERMPFFRQVAEALEHLPDLHILFSMREDFIAELTPFAGILPRGLSDRFRLERMRPDAALKAIRRPAEQSGCPFDEDVAEELLENLRRAQIGRAAPGAESEILSEFVEPVHLQIVCRRLWHGLGEDRKSITRDDLVQLGDVDRALHDFYDDALKQVLFPSEESPAKIREHQLRAWFENTDLVTSARTRGLVYRDTETTAGLDNAIVDLLVDTYLIRAVQRGSDTWYELAHDRLVEPILASNRLWRSRHLKPLTAAADAWSEAEEDPRRLYDGAQLRSARIALEASPSSYSELERRFVAAGVALEELRDRRRRRGVLTGVLVFVMLASAAVSGWWLRRHAVIQGQIAQNALDQAEEQAQIVESGRLVNAAYLSNRLDLSSLLAIEGHRIADTMESRRALLFTAQAEPRLDRYLATGGKTVVDPTGRFAASFGGDGMLRWWDLNEMTPILEILGGGEPISFSPDGRYLAAVSVLPTDGGIRLMGQGFYEQLRLWDAQTRRLVKTWNTQGIVALAWGIEQVADGPSSLVLAVRRDLEAVSLYREAGSPVWSDEPRRLEIPGRRIAFDPEGVRAASAEGAMVRLWDVISGEPFGDEFLAGPTFAFDPRGALLATGDDQGRLRLWDLADFSAPRPGQSVNAHDSAIRDLVFSPDGAILASIGEDLEIRLWRYEDAETIEPYGEALSEPGHRVSFRRGGLQAATTNDDDGLLRSWFVERRVRPRLVRALRENFPEVETFAVHPSEPLLATGSGDDVRFWNLVDGRAIGNRLVGHDGAVLSVAFHPYQRLLVSAGRDRMIRLWDLRDLEQPKLHAVLEGHQGSIAQTAFSVDGAVLASGTESRYGGEEEVRLWSLNGLWTTTEFPEIAEPLAHDLPISALAFTSRGALITATQGGPQEASREAIRFWTKQTDGSYAARKIPGRGTIVLLSPGDGRILTKKQRNLQLSTFQIEDSSLGSPLIEVPAGPHATAAFSPNGRILAVGSRKTNTVQLWNLESGGSLGELKTGSGGFVRSVAYDADGKTLIALSDSGTVWLWNMRAEFWKAQNCRRANRNLTPAEWRRYLGADAEYRITCPELLPDAG